MDSAKEKKYLDTLRKASEKIKALLHENEALKRNDAIAVIGIGCRFPGGVSSPGDFWKIVRDKIDTVTLIPPDRWDVDAFYDPDPTAPGKMYTKSGAFIDKFDHFDPSFFGITPVEAKEMDPQHRILLEVSWEALENAGIDPNQLRGSRTGVFLGYSNYDYFRAHIHSDDFARIDSFSASGVMVSVCAGRLSYFYDFKGPTLSVDTACSSSLVSLTQAVKNLQSGACDMALTGGVTLNMSPDGFIGLSKVMALSPDGRCKSFDNSADGYGRGEGCGVVVLKRLQDAQRDGDRVYAVIKGCAVNHDGRSNGLTAPNGPAQTRIIHEALNNAGISPGAIDLIEAHGTGTILGDPIEVNALHAVFGASRTLDDPLYLGSVKTNIGHTEAAAGVAGVIKLVLSLYHQQIPPSLHYKEPNKHILWDEIPIEVNTTLRDWPANDSPRAGGVSSFGLSGTNCHVVIEEYCQPPRQQTNPPCPPVSLLTLSTKTESALDQLASRYINTFAEPPSPLSDICFTASAGRSHFPKRMAVVTGTALEFTEELQSYIKDKKAKNTFISNESVCYGNKGIVFLFSGQGAQYVGMGRGLYQDQPVFREALNQCSEILQPWFEKSLLDYLFADNAQEEELNQTAVTQPALFALEYALIALWRSWGVEPVAVIGHSIGEYAAAYAAGVFSLEDALNLAAERGKRMQALAPNGSMAAVFASEKQVLELIGEHKGVINIAAVNTPERVTITGHSDALKQCAQSFEQHKIPCKFLPVSHAFHSSLIEPMVDEFEQTGRTISYSSPVIPFYSTLTGDLIDGNTPVNSVYWGKQIVSPVRFYDAVSSCLKDGFDLFLELGPSHTLASFGRQCKTDKKCLWLNSLQKKQQDMRCILSCLGRMYVNGMDMDWRKIYPGATYQKTDIPTYPFERKKYFLNLLPSANNEHKHNEIVATDEGMNHDKNKHDNPEQDCTEIMNDKLKNDLIKLVADIGGFDLGDIQPDVRLLEMGFDSLLLFKIVQTIEKKYGIELKVSQFFNELQTLDDVAQCIAVNAPNLSISSDAVEQDAPQQQAFQQNLDIAIPPSLQQLDTDNAVVKLMQQQLQQLSALSNQNMASMQGLIQQQLNVLGKTDAASLTVSSSVQKKVATEDKQSTSVKTVRNTKKAEEFRSLNLKKLNTLTDTQKAWIQTVVDQYIKRTSTSKEITQQSRKILADWKHTLSFWNHLKEAKYPIVSDHSQGARFWDKDGNEYVDIAMGMGVHIFGHRPAFLVESLNKQITEGFEIGPQSDLTGKVATLIHELTGVERVTFCNTGTESVMVAIRLARAATGKNTVVLFKNSYHGIFDGVLATETEDGLVPFSVGTPVGMIENLVLLDYDSAESLSIIEGLKDELAAVLVEPVQSRNPDLQPQLFLRKLRRITERCNAALIFDEMINGFRIHAGGAQAWFGVQADIITYGKIAGGGLPVGIIAGKARYMDYIDGGYWQYGDQSGPHADMIFFGGTFARNPMSMAGAYAVLSELQKKGPALQEELNQKTGRLCLSLNYFFEKEQVPIRAQFFASQWRLVPVGINDNQPLEMEILFLLMLMKGVYAWERRINFISTAHSNEDIALIENAIKQSIYEIRANGFEYIKTESASNQFYPITSVQRRMIAMAQRPGGELAYHITQAFWIDGPLDVDLLEDGFAEIIRRHDSLRTRFLWMEGEWVQYVGGEPRFSIERIDSTEESIDQNIRSFIRPFDLSKVPLLRIALLKVSETRHLLLGDAHHIALDGISFTVMATELMSLYQGVALQPVEYQYSDGVKILDEWQDSAAYQQQEAFWQETLAAPLPVLNLPTDFARPQEFDYSGSMIFREIPKGLKDKLNNLARTNGVSMYMVLLACYKILLYKLTQQEDLLVGMPASGRLDARLSKTVGMFVNSIIARTRIDGKNTFAEFLLQVKEACSRSYDNQDYPFEKMAEKMNGDRPKHLNAIFDTMLAYEKTDDRAFRIKDLTFTDHHVHSDTAMFDFYLDMYEDADQLSLHFIYAAQLFKQPTIQRWSEYFVQILELVTSDPDRPLFTIDVRSGREIESIAALNQTAADYPSDKNITALFEEQACKTPERIAVVCGEKSLTYQQLNQKANAIAHALIESHSVRSGDRIGGLLNRSEQAIAVFLGILKAGGTYVPMDPDYPAARLEYIFEHSQCAVIITDVMELDSYSSSIRRKMVALSTLDSKNTDNPSIPVDMDANAYVIYTSGSTGKPKGCMISHRNVVRLMKNGRHDFDFCESDVWIIAHSFCFDFSVWEMYGALLYGGKVVVAQKEDVRDTQKFLALIKQHQVTVLNQTPAAFRNLIDVEDQQEAHQLCDHLRYVIFGGDRLDPSSLQKWVCHYPLKRIALINMYGITETTVHVSYYRIKDRDISQPDGRSLIGRPLPETSIYICDANMNQQPIGVAGEMYIGGSGVGLGYLHAPDLTCERFIQSPFNQNERLYKSGDMARCLADDVIEYIGRNDHQVQVRGFRIEPGEIQTAMQTHPVIEKSFVSARKNNVGTDELIAYYTSVEKIDSKVLRDYLSDIIPYYMIPSYFVQVDDFPITSNGKIDIKNLPVPEDLTDADGRQYSAPQSATEQVLEKVWAAVLGVKQVSRNDNFFNLGGDSIKAILIQTKLYQEGIAFDIKTLFKYPSIAVLATHLQITTKIEAKPLSYDQDALSPIQHWFFESHSSDLHHFNQSVLLKTKKTIDLKIIKTVIKELLSQHESLRMTYPLVDGSIKPTLTAFDLDSCFIEVDFRDAQNALQQMQTHASDMQSQFDLAKGPLVKIIYYHMPDGDRLFFVMHHLIIDGVSWRVLLGDFIMGYEQLLHNKKLALGFTSDSYSQWAAALQMYSQSETQLQEIPYWNSQESQNVKSIPVDFACASNRYADEEKIEMSLSEEETSLLLTKANQVYQTQTVEILLTAFVLAMQEWTNQDCMRLFLEGHGRAPINPPVNINRTIGWFTALYPVIFNVSHCSGFTESVQSVQDTLRRIPNNGIGYGILRYAASALSKQEFKIHSTWDVVFNYLGQFDDVDNEHFSISDETTGEDCGQQLERLFLLEINSAVDEKRFSLSMAYNKNIHRRESITNLLNLFTAKLKQILETARSSDGHFIQSSPSFEYWDLSTSDLERALKVYGFSLEDVDDILPMSPLQEGMLFHAMSEEGAKSYFVQFNFSINGQFDKDIFIDCWNDLVDRHPVLRTVFIYDRVPEPMQVVIKKMECEFLFEDLRSLTPTQAADRVKQSQIEDRNRFFDLNRGPLMRFTILQLTESCFEIVWSHHHIVLDGWSVAILHEEFVALYRQRKSCVKAELPAVKPYQDFIRWLQKQDMEPSRIFWRKYLDGVTAPSYVPGGQSTSSSSNYQVQEHIFTLPKDQSTKLCNFAQRNQATLSTVFQTAWAVLLSRYNNADECVFGIVLSGRPAQIEGVDNIVGLFLQTIPIRIKVNTVKTFNELLHNVQTSILDCFLHQYYPIADIMACTNLHNELINHLIVFENYPEPEYVNQPEDDPLGFVMSNLRSHEQMNYDFSIVIHPKDEIEIKFSVNTNVFTKEDAIRIESHLRTLISCILESEHFNIQNLDLSEKPDTTLIQDDNIIPEDESKTEILLDLFEKQVKLSPDSIAIDDDKQEISYQQLDDHSSFVAKALKKAGCRRESNIAVFMGNGADYIAAIIAIQKSCGVFAPINPDVPIKRLETILDLIEARIIVTNNDQYQHLLELLPKISYRPKKILVIKTPDLCMLHDYVSNSKSDIKISETKDISLEERPSPQDSIYILFSSGSTGEPKAILGTHEGLTHFIKWQIKEFNIGSDIRVSNLSTTMFDVSLRDIFLPLLSGGEVCIPTKNQRENFHLLFEWFKQKRISATHIVPGFFRLLIQDAGIAGKTDQLPDLRYIFFAGEPLFGRDVESALRTFGNEILCVNIYGPSETTLAKFFHRISTPVNEPNKMVYVGKPITGTKVYILKNGHQAAVGEIGEICIQPPFACKGFYKNPKMTAQKFIPNPITKNPADIIYTTGDLGRLHTNGDIEILGRLDRQVKIAGVRIELVEIDEAVMKYPDINQAFSILHKRNSKDSALTCYYTVKNPVDIDDLKNFLQDHLPSIFIPEFLIPLDRFPLNLNGKIDMKSLPKPDALVYDRFEYKPPTNKTEEELEKLWKQVLGLGRIGVETPFLSIGGNSLKAIRLISRINSFFDVEVRIKTFFERATIKKMAEFIQSQIQQTESSIQVLPTQPDYAVSHAQLRLWILDQMEIDAKAYNIPGALRCEGKMDATALQTAFNMLIQRHEILRTTFKNEGKNVRQVVHDKMDFAITTVDLTDVPNPENEAQSICSNDAAKPFDLSTGPLLRVLLLQLKKDSWILFFNIHHIVFDGWSVAVLSQELFSIYEKCRQGVQPDLPPLHFQYKDYAGWQNAYLASEKVYAHQKYWNDKLEKRLSTIDLPLDYTRPPIQTFNGDTASSIISADIVDKFRRICLDLDGSLYMGMVCLIKILLFRYTSQKNIVIGSPVAGRDQLEFENQIGFYVNTLILADELDGQHTFADTFSQIKQTITEALEHSIYPFDKIVDDIAPERDMSRPPIVEVMLVYQNFDSPAINIDGIHVQEFEFSCAVSRFTIAYIFEENPDGTISFRIEYNTDLFKPDRIKRMSEHFNELLNDVLTNHTKSINQFSIIPGIERKQIFDQPNIDSASLSPDVMLVDMFKEWVKSSPDSIAVICDEHQLTYAQLDKLTNQLANCIHDQWGVKKGERIGVLMERSEWVVIAWIGILKAGCVYVPFDLSYPARRIAYMIKDSDCSLVLTDETQKNEWNDIAKKVVPITEIHDADSAYKKYAISGDDLAYIIYTSGSTGKPKGVQLEHRGAVNLCYEHREGIGVKPSDNVLQFASMSFDASVWEMSMALMQGACLVIAQQHYIQNTARLSAYLKKHQVSIATLPPTYVTGLSLEDLSSLRILITAGEPPRQEDVRRFSKHLQYINAYGPTETTICASYYKFGASESLNGALPIGKPIRNFQILILDSYGNIAPIGIPGEICVAGVGLAHGYINKDELNRKTFVPHPYQKNHRLYKTGDVGCLHADGNLEFLGRMDNQIKIRGYRVELSEIEQAILSYPNMMHAAVVVKENQQLTKELAAYYVSEQDIEWHKVRSDLGRTLPDYMIPAIGLQIDQLPLLPNGKIDSKKLLTYEISLQHGEQKLDPPENALQETIQKIWMTIMGKTQIGVRQRFFEIGGDSIQAIQIITKLNETGYQAEIQDLFLHPTIESFASIIKPLNASSETPGKEIEQPYISRVNLDPDDLDDIFDDE